MELASKITVDSWQSTEMQPCVRGTNPLSGKSVQELFVQTPKKSDVLDLRAYLCQAAAIHSEAT